MREKGSSTNPNNSFANSPKTRMSQSIDAEMHTASVNDLAGEKEHTTTSPVLHSPFVQPLLVEESRSVCSEAKSAAVTPVTMSQPNLSSKGFYFVSNKLYNNTES